MAQQVDVIRMEPDIIMSSSQNVPVSNTGSIVDYQVRLSQPVELESGQIHFKLSQMIEGKYYPFHYKNKDYLLCKSRGNIVDLLEVKSKGKM
jgi:hypothetical protein